MHQDAKDILYTEEQLKARVAELGRQISADYKGESVVLVGVLKGAIVFFTDLARSIDENVDVSFDFISCSSYGSGTTSTGVVRILKDLDRSVEGKHVLVVEDIVDTGTTLHYLLENLHARGAKSVRLAALLNKPERRKMDVEVDSLLYYYIKNFLKNQVLLFPFFFLNLICILYQKFFKISNILLRILVQKKLGFLVL